MRLISYFIFYGFVIYHQNSGQANLKRWRGEKRKEEKRGKKRKEERREKRKEEERSEGRGLLRTQMKEGVKTLKTGVDGKSQDIFEIRVTIQFPHSGAITLYLLLVYRTIDKHFSSIL